MATTSGPFSVVRPAQWAPAAPVIADPAPVYGDRVEAPVPGPADDARAARTERPVKRVRFASREERTSVPSPVDYPAPV